MIHNAITTKRALAVATVAGLTLAVCLATLDGALSADPPLSNEGVRRILVFGDAAPNNPPRQQALMERSIKLVAETFKAHGYEVDLIPTTELGSSIVKERFAHYARTLGINDTFVMYSHSHGNRRGTFFAEWDEYASAILALPARNVVIFSMSCHSGNLTDTLNRHCAVNTTETKFKDANDAYPCMLKTMVRERPFLQRRTLFQQRVRPS